jgi:FdhE protein
MDALPHPLGNKEQKMFPVEFAENLTMDSGAAAEEMCGAAPELSPIIRAFAMLVQKRTETEMDLPGLPVPDLNEEAFGAGEPFIASIDPSLFYSGFAASARRLLPVLGNLFAPIQSQAAGLLSALVAMPGLTAPLIQASLTGDLNGFGAIAAKTVLPVGALSFLAGEVLKPCLRAFEQRVGLLADDALWCRDRCPVCGGGPDYGLLKEKRDPSEFLLSKSGRLWLHCPLCGHLWRFVRLVCPACGENRHEKLDILTATGRERERIHACRTCNRYLPVIDLVDSPRKLHPDLAPLVFIPLDILAGKAGFAPIAPAPWNQLR